MEELWRRQMVGSNGFQILQTRSESSPTTSRAPMADRYFLPRSQKLNQGLEPDERDGFVVITAAADQGLVDIHDRKPLVLSPETAREWLDPATTDERLEATVEVGCRPAQDFRWFPVGKAVGNVRNQGHELIEPVSEQNRQGDLEL